MDLKGIESISVIERKDNSLSRLGAFPVFAWYILNVLELDKRFEIISVKSKRNNNKHINYRSKPYTESKMSVAIVSLILLQVDRFSKIKDKFCDEVEVAKLIGLEKFFSDQTAYNFINAFQKWHIDQLERVNTSLLRDFGNCCKLAEGNTSSLSYFSEVLDKALSVVESKSILLRVDSGYLSADVLNYACEHNIFILCGCPYNYVMSQESNKNKKIEWKQHNSNTWFFDLGLTDIVKKSKYQFRAVLVKKEQELIKIKKAEKFIYYCIVSNLYLTQLPETIYTEYHKRQTIENFFKEVKNPFNSTKMPSQLFHGNEAFLWFECIAYNCFQIFKKTVYQSTGKNIHIKHFLSE